MGAVSERLTQEVCSNQDIVTLLRKSHPERLQKMATDMGFTADTTSPSFDLAALCAKWTENQGAKGRSMNGDGNGTNRNATINLNIKIDSTKDKEILLGGGGRKPME